VTHSQQRHDASVAAVAGYCRQRTATQLAAEIRGLRPQGPPAAGGAGADIATGNGSGGLTQHSAPSPQ